jgi:hypothetical protein
MSWRKPTRFRLPDQMVGYRESGCATLRKLAGTNWRSM